MLPSKNNRAAGEFEGARPASSLIIAIKNVHQDFLTSEARFFVKRKLHKKCGVHIKQKPKLLLYMGAPQVRPYDISKLLDYFLSSSSTTV